MSDVYAIKETTLTAIGDAIRNKVIGKDPYIQDRFELMKDLWGPKQYKAFSHNVVKTKLRINNITTSTGLPWNPPDSTSSYTVGSLGVILYSHSGSGSWVENDIAFFIPKDAVFPYEVIIDSNEITLFYKSSSGIDDNILIDIEIFGLDENDNNFKYTPLEMADMINNSFEEIQITDNGIYTPPIGKMGFSKIEVNMPLIPESGLIVTGNCQYRFAENGYNWLIPHIKYTQNISNAERMFYNSTQITEIPFEINLDGKKQRLNNIVSYTKITTPPTINNCVIEGSANLFENVKMISYFPDDYGTNWDWSVLDSGTSPYSNSCGYIFNGCYSLRKFPMEFFKHHSPVSNWNPSNSNYYYGFNYCYSLDEIVNMIVLPNSFTSNAFYNHIQNCSRLKDYIFEMNEDGTPKVAPWKNQILDFSTTGYLVYDFYKSDIINHSTGITADKQVTNDATYQALKNDPDWFSSDVKYSRYNHTSAVNTINSLPDCSATGTNTIKFSGASGALTDGGAINTLTEEEIAVATAKGWTVSLV